MTKQLLCILSLIIATPNSGMYQALAERFYLGKEEWYHGYHLYPRELFPGFSFDQQTISLHVLDGEPISDARLLEQNPEWQKLKSKLCAQEKWLALDGALDFRIGDETEYSFRRIAIALAVCIGANPRHQKKYRDETALEWPVRYNDMQLVSYLLARGADPNNTNVPRRPHEGVLRYASTIAMAQLLIQNGAKLDKDIFFQIVIHNHPNELLQFYLTATDLRPTDDMNLFHPICGTYPYNPNARELTRTLLNIGLNSSTQDNKGWTPLHILAFQGCRAPEWNELLMEFLSPYLKLHTGFLAFLFYLRQEWPLLYAQKGLLAQQFGKIAHEPMNKLKALLSIKNNIGYIAYHYCHDYLLSPKKVRYARMRARIRLCILVKYIKDQIKLIKDPLCPFLKYKI